MNLVLHHLMNVLLCLCHSQLPEELFLFDFCSHVWPYVIRTTDQLHSSLQGGEGSSIITDSREHFVLYVVALETRKGTIDANVPVWRGGERLDDAFKSRGKSCTASYSKIGFTSALSLYQVTDSSGSSLTGRKSSVAMMDSFEIKTTWMKHFQHFVSFCDDFWFLTWQRKVQEDLKNWTLSSYRCQ